VSFSLEGSYDAIDRPLSVAAHRRRAALSLLSGFASHDGDVSISLIGDHIPAAGEAGEDGGFGSALRQKHEAMTFLSLGSATGC
jgi:hypothetical protein